jgi:hypothetical protein
MDEEYRKTGEKKTQEEIPLTKNLILDAVIYFYSFIIVIMVCFVSKGCIPNSDSTEDLSGHYFYRDEGEHVKDILCHIPNRQEIYSEVIDYAYDSDFIVVVQQPVYSEYKAMIGFNLRSTLKKYSANSKEDVAKSENEADSILVNDYFYQSVFKNKINYWIISHKAQQLYGPFTKDEYKEKRKDLRVPESLQITDP